MGIYSQALQPKPLATALAELCWEMRTTTLLVGSHRWRLRTFKQSFIGSEAVSWIANRLHISRELAVYLGQLCLRKGLFDHVLGEQDFADAAYYYRFSQDGLPEHRVFDLQLPQPVKIHLVS